MNKQSEKCDKESRPVSLCPAVHVSKLAVVVSLTAVRSAWQLKLAVAL